MVTERIMVTLKIEHWFGTRLCPKHVTYVISLTLHPDTKKEVLLLSLAFCWPRNEERFITGPVSHS